MSAENTTDSIATTETSTTDAATQATDSSSSTTNATETNDETLLGGAKEGDETPEQKAEREAEEARAAETPEQKAAREADEARAALFGAPEGEYELTLPEGVTDVDKDVLAAVTPVAKELGLSNEGLSKIAGVYATDVLPTVAKQITTGMEQNHAASVKAWADEARRAVEGGKDGDNVIEPDPIFAGKTMKEVTSIAARAIDRFGGPELRQYFDATGTGNYPAMLRFAFLAGSAISEDTSFERGTTTSAAPKSREEKYYGSSQKTTT